MAKKRFRGKDFIPRGSNRRYEQLNDLDALYERLKAKSPADVARDLCVPYNSIRFLIDKYFTVEEQMMIRWARRPHKNIKRDKI